MRDEHLRQLTLERADLIDRLSRARQLLAYAQGYVSGQVAADMVTINDPDHVHPAQSKVDEIKAFLAEGLFGTADDKETTK